MQLFFASENFYFSWFYVVNYSFSLLCNILEIENKAIYNEMM